MDKKKAVYVPTVGEEIGNAVSHGVMSLLSLLALPFAAVWAYAHDPGGVLASVSVSVFVISIFLMFLASTLYHSMNPQSKHKEVFHILDHIFIYVAIAGSYTPIALSVIGGWQGVFITVLQWAMVIFGVFYIIGKTKCDEIKNEMRPSWRKAWSKRNATKISHTRKNTVRTTTKRCSNGIFLSQKQRSLRSLLVIANHPLLLSTTTRFRGTDGPLDAVDDPPVALGVSVDHIERKHRQHKLSLHCLE